MTTPTTPFSTESSSTELLERIEFLNDQLDDAYFRIRGLDEDIADKRKMIASLQRQLAKFESEGVKPGLVEDLFQLWANLNGKQKNTKLSPDRRKAINAALKLYGEADVRKVIAQNAKTPYLVYTAWRASGQAESKRDITDFLGKGKHFDALLEIANTAPEINWTEDRISQAHVALLSNETVMEKLNEGKGWTREILDNLGVGLAESRLICPVRDETGTLTGVVKYHPRFKDEHKDLPKSLADGKRGMFPAPESVDSDVVWLVEGEADAISAHEMWLPGVGLPGASVSPGDWMKRLQGRRVVICLDCDEAGRKCANKIARPLTQYAAEVRVVDLDPARNDGFDLTDWFKQGRQRKTLEEMARQAEPVTRARTVPLPQQKSSDPNDFPDLFNDFVRALEQRDCGPKEVRGGQWVARCPVHDDKVPTLHFSLGEVTPVVADCKAGCEWSAIKEVLAWPARKEF